MLNFRMKFRVIVLFTVCLVSSSIAVGELDGLARGDADAGPYLFACNRGSLPADFTNHDALRWGDVSQEKTRLSRGTWSLCT